MHTRATLSNGVRIVNFSSPHPFTFADGTVLDACAAEFSRTLNLEQVEVAVPHPTLPGVEDIALKFKMTPAVALALTVLDNDPTVDVVLVPFPVMGALKDACMGLGKARVCRMADRVTKATCFDKFCV